MNDNFEEKKKILEKFRMHRCFTFIILGAKKFFIFFFKHFFVEVH